MTGITPYQRNNSKYTPASEQYFELGLLCVNEVKVGYIVACRK